MNTPCLLVAACTIAATLVGCAQLPTARMQPPPELDAVQALVMHGLPRAGAGRFTFDDIDFSFKREHDTLTLFGTAAVQRATLALAWRGPHGGEQDVRCESRQLDAGRGGLGATLLPLQMSCQGSTGSFALTEHLKLSARVRQGEYRAGAVALQVQSVHRVQGSPLPLAEPAGYLLRHEGRVVAALDLAGGTPRLLRASPDAAVLRACTEAAVVLALSTWGA